MDAENKAASTVPAAPQQEPPRRRVGSLTLGVCLIAAGIFFGCYYFVPGFDGQLVLKIAPAAGLVLLGCEVLFFACRPGRWKYDFWSVLICLVLMGVCFGFTVLAAWWDDFDPERRQTALQLGQEYTAEAYAQIRETAPEVALKDVSGNLYLYHSTDGRTLQQLQPGEGYLSLSVTLFGPYDSTEAFAQDCRSIADAVQQCRPQPDTLIFAWSPDNDPEESLGTGTLQQVEQYTLELVGIAQLDWTADQMAKQTEVQYLLDEENEPEEQPASGEEMEPDGTE